MRVTDVLAVGAPTAPFRIALVDVDYVEEAAQSYVLPVALLEGREAQQILDEHPNALIAGIGDAEHGDVIIDASYLPAFREALLDLAHARRKVTSRRGEVTGSASGGLRRHMSAMQERTSRLLGAEQSNTSIVFGRDIVIKIYRRLEEGTSLDLEVGQFLGERGFEHTPQVLGSIEYRREAGPPRTVAVVQEFVENEGDAWDLTLDAVTEYFERAATISDSPTMVDASTRALLDHADEGGHDRAREFVGPYIEEARLLGQRTGDMHLVLAGAENGDFAVEPFTMFYQRSLYQSMRNLAGRVLQQLGGTLGSLEGEMEGAAREVLSLEPAIMRRFRTLVDHKVNGGRIRVHGDYHLGQVLYTGNDFYITDFEGEPIRPLSERRLKRSPLRDVAGMLRSFHYAAYAALYEREEHGHVRDTDRAAAEWWARCWYAFVSGAFLNGYLGVMRGSPVLPADNDELTRLLDAYMLEKAIYELGYELGNRPAWAMIPLRGLVQLLNDEERAK